MAQAHLEMGEARRASELYGAALEVLGDVVDDESRANLLLSRGIAEMKSHDQRAAMLSLETAIGVARESGSSDVEADSALTLAQVHIMNGDMDEARLLINRAHMLILQRADRRSRARALTQLGAVLVEAGDRAAAVVALNEALEIARDEPDDELADRVADLIAEVPDR